MRFEIKHTRTGKFVLERLDHPGRHSHFNTREQAEECLSLIKQRKLPADDYRIESCRRLLTKEEFKTLRRSRRPVRYRNQPRGRR